MALFSTKNTTNPLDQEISRALEKERLLSRQQYREYQRQAKVENRHVTEVLYDAPEVPADRLLEVLANLYELPTVSLRERVISPYVLNLLPKEIAAQHGVVVFKKVKDVIHVATASPANDDVVQFIAKQTELTPEVFLATPEDIQLALRRYAGELTTEFAKIIEQSTAQAISASDDEEKLAQFLPIITMVETIIDRAIAARASDIHFEPRQQAMHIRYRVDGLLQHIVTVPLAVAPALVARLKLLSGMKIDEHRLPQDGRLTYPYRDYDVAIRVSAVPTLYGTKMVLRLLDQREQRYSLSTLGLNPKDMTRIRAAMNAPQGLLLVSGPTGSGKTTTLYTILGLLNKDHVNIATIEDPIEYGLDGINQTQVNVNAGLSFAAGLRSLLRQDPNVIMVGEIRDSETAEIAINAAMTGHLVLSTIHTNAADQALQRLSEMGVPPYLTAPVTRLLIGQRLVRKICPSCAVKQASTKVFARYATRLPILDIHASLQQRGYIPTDQTPGQVTLMTGRGCDRCQQTGYLGRLGIYELIPVDQADVHDLVGDVNALHLQQLAKSKGCLTMLEDGVLKVFSGQTTFDEVLRVVRD